MSEDAPHKTGYEDTPTEVLQKQYADDMRAHGKREQALGEPIGLTWELFSMAQELLRRGISI